MSSHIKFYRKIQNLPENIKEALLTLLEEIEQTVTKKEFNDLKEIVKELSKNVNELTIAQRYTEQRLKELAEAQKKTEEELKKLTGEHRKTREMLGGLSHTVGD